MRLGPARTLLTAVSVRSSALWPSRLTGPCVPPLRRRLWDSVPPASVQPTPSRSRPSSTCPPWPSAFSSSSSSFTTSSLSFFTSCFSTCPSCFFTSCFSSSTSYFATSPSCFTTSCFSNSPSGFTTSCFSTSPSCFTTSCFSTSASCFSSSTSSFATSPSGSTTSCFSTSASCFSTSSSCGSAPRAGMDLAQVVAALEALAPLELAESWDNVGLLVEPSPPRAVRAALLTTDLTPPVLEEAEARGAGLVVAYHPPLFRPVRRLTCSSWKERLAVRALELGVAVYSPHTALDCLAGGVNDWLCAALGSGSVSVLTQAESSAPVGQRLEFRVDSPDDLTSILRGLDHIQGVSYQHHSCRGDRGDVTSVSVSCPPSALTPAVQLLSSYSAAYGTLTILQTKKPPLPGCGQGRVSVLDDPVPVSTAVQRIKSYLGLAHVRLALGAQCTLDSTVRTVAVCAGSGGSVLKGVKADLYLTGEMSHHDVLDAVAAGTSVVLCEHTNTERGFLSVLQDRLAARLGPGVSVLVSERDADPLRVV